MKMHHICNDDIYCANSIYKNENSISIEKLNDALLSFYHNDSKHIYIIYLLYDAMHNGNSGEFQLIDKLLFKTAKTTKTELFNVITTSEENKEKKPEDIKPFVSIKSRAEAFLVENKLSKEEIMNEMLSKVDISRITNIVNSHIVGVGERYSKETQTRVNKEQIEKWLKKWAELKWMFYVQFNRNFFIKTTVKYEKADWEFCLQLNELCAKYPKYALNVDMFDVSEYRKNRIDFSRDSILEKIFPMKAGMKVSKYLSQLIGDTQFDIDLSKILQDKYIEQDLYISIDPYDYLTSSINRSGWRSCHNFIDGEHAVGSASYMFDDCTLVAYMTHGKEYEYNLNNYKFKGNSKNWRQLIYVDTADNRCIFSRQYPQDYNNADVAKYTRELLEENMSKFCDINNIWKISRNKSLKGTHYHFPYTMAYNDIPYQETSMIKHKYHDEVTHMMTIGGAVPCPVCGTFNISDNYSCLCQDCRTNIKKQLSDVQKIINDNINIAVANVISPDAISITSSPDVITITAGRDGDVYSIPTPF